MTGYGFVAGGTATANDIGTPLTQFTDPTCPADAGTLTGSSGTSPGTGCTGTTWSSTSSLCMSGSIPALTACSDAGGTTGCSGTEAENYSEDWGAEVGVSAGSASTATVGGSFTKLSVAFTGTPATGIRLQVSDGTNSYCFPNYTSGTAVTASQLVEACWGTTGNTPLSSLGAITQVQLQIPSASAAISFSSFCMTGITFQ
jgi:hypothetical protein